MDDSTIGPLFAIEPSNLTAKLRRPSILHDNFLPDMGIIFGDWLLGVEHGCSAIHGPRPIPAH